MYPRSLIAIAALVVVTSAAGAQSASPPAPKMPPPPTTDLVVAGRKLANWILANQLDSVAMNLAPNSNADSVRADLTRLVGEIAIRGGNELKVTEEKVVRRNGNYQYWRISDFENAPSAVLLRVVVTPDGKYAGIGIGLANNPPPVDP
jgi:hypothetical protein